MGDEEAQFVGYLTEETGLFFGHMQSALSHYLQTKKLPPSLFADKYVQQVDAEVQKQAAAAGSGHGKQKKEKGSRKPTGYNLYMKEKMEELKASGAQPSEDHQGDRNPLFAMAAGGWKNLSKEQKQVYATRAAEGGAAPAAAAPTATATPGAETSKKKRKKHHKEQSEKKHKHKKRE